MTEPLPLIAVLRQHQPVLFERFGVTTLQLFGSQARGTAGPESDVDLLVSFQGSATARQFFGVQFYLEDLLNRRVDLVTGKALRPELVRSVAADAVTI